ncbi:MAG: ATP synthase F1 subunit epsilon [Clostridiales bacterium]|nr:ATP synthase F1 subunit epsilon [Clostridiales bacterium]
MASTYMLEIVTPDRKFFSGEVEMSIIRTTTGDMAILNDHELTVAPLLIGSIQIKFSDETKTAACSSGFVNIGEKLVTIITDSAEWPEEIDFERAKAAIKRAENRLKEKNHEIDVARAKISLSRAMNRVNIAEKQIDHSNL